MTTRPRGIATYLVITLLLSSISISVVHAFKHDDHAQSKNWICEPYGDSHYCGSTDQDTDKLDPNDCSRGIDESNQETCDLGGAQ